jgi:hypothetical protein
MKNWGMEYFKYPASNWNYDGEEHNHPEWENKWANALTWDDWMVKQCAERLGSKHQLQESRDYCVQMWKCEQTPNFHWHKDEATCKENTHFFDT